MPRYYPICLEVAKFPCLVVGGGAVGLRKVRTLLAHRAKVTVVATKAAKALQSLARRGKITLHRRPYRMSDLGGMRLVFVATNDARLNRRIADEAGRLGLLSNVVDDPELCDFIVPSIVRRGRLFLAISTEGACPAYAKRLRVRLERQFDQAYAAYVELLARIRRRILARVADPKVGVGLLERLLDEDLLGVIRKQGRRAAEARARALLHEWLKTKR